MFMLLSLYLYLNCRDLLLLRGSQLCRYREQVYFSTSPFLYIVLEYYYSLYIFNCYMMSATIIWYMYNCVEYIYK